MALVFALATVFAGNAAEASRGWCRADPQFLIRGQLVRVTVDAQVPNMRVARTLSTGPIGVVLTVPHGTRVEHLASDDGFGYGYDVAVEYVHELGASARVAVYVPMKNTDVSVHVSFIPAGLSDAAAEQGERSSGTSNSSGGQSGESGLVPGTAVGTANSWIVLTV